MSFSDQARAIYRELRLLDAEAAACRVLEGLQPDGARPEFDDVLH